jgi:hypothetical protein
MPLFMYNEEVALRKETQLHGLAPSLITLTNDYANYSFRFSK